MEIMQAQFFMHNINSCAFHMNEPLHFPYFCPTSLVKSKAGPIKLKSYMLLFNGDDFPKCPTKTQPKGRVSQHQAFPYDSKIDCLHFPQNPWVGFCKNSFPSLTQASPKMYPLGSTNIAGWNIPIFNRIHTSSIRGPHFPLLAMLVDPGV